MQKIINRLHFDGKGFTLVELMVVVVIIGIMVAIAIPVYNSITIRAEQATIEANLRIIDSAITQYYAFSKKEVKQGYQVTLLSLSAIAGSLNITPTALVMPEPEYPSALDEVEDLVSAGYLASVPTGPGNVSYGIIGEASNQRATATGAVGKDTLNGTTFNDLPWRKANGSSNHTIDLSDGLSFGSSGWSSSFLMGPYTGSSANITIPTTLNGVNVTRIWQDVFNTKQAGYSGAKLDSIIFSADSNIDHIHARAFQANNLSEVVLPENLKRIDRLAFAGNNIASVIIPDSVTTIEEKAFTGLEEITVGSNLNFITHPQGNHAQLENSINGNNAFRDAYMAENGGAGTYVWNGVKWIKQ
jgi:prepilin-type N-terminal cleavage/methylation domain-containing protein